MGKAPRMGAKRWGKGWTSGASGTEPAIIA
jgi:hypothetical protein